MNLHEDFFQNFQENEGPRQVDLVNSGKSLTLFFTFRPRDWCVYREEVRRGRLVWVDFMAFYRERRLSYQC